MDCPTCGKEVLEQDAFCKHCGARISEAGAGPRSAAVDDMIAEYRKALVDNPSDPDAFYNVGLGLLYCGNYGAAADAFRKVTELLPDDPAAYEKLAVVLVKLDQHAEAIVHARKAHGLDPRRASVIRLLRVLEG
jgi:Flp pilus assembly protein TadD